MKEFVEQRIISAVRNLLNVQVNNYLKELQFVVPLVELGNYSGADVVSPVVSLSVCEQTEKERIIRQEVYSVTITFNLPETMESELHCYAYSGAVAKALYDNPTLGGVVNRAVVTGKKYNFPKKQHNGEGYGLVVTLRLTVEGMGK